MGDVLSILGLFLTVALSGPVITFSVRAWIRFRSQRRWSADLHVDKKQISISTDYAVEFWKECVTVDDNGNASKSVDARIRNITSAPLTQIAPPVYGDPKFVTKESIRPWAHTGRKKLNIEIVDWIAERARGRIRIHFAPALPPASRLRLHYGHDFPAAFAEGQEWYTCDIGTPHYEADGEIIFDAIWQISSLRWEGYYQDKNAHLCLKENTIYWRIPFPKSGERIDIRFVLTRKQ